VPGKEKSPQVRQHHADNEKLLEHIIPQSLTIGEMMSDGDAATIDGDISFLRQMITRGDMEKHDKQGSQ